MRYVVWTLVTLLVLPIAAGLLALFWPDAELSADAQRLLSQQPALVAADRNLFNGLMGFNAPPEEQDFVAHGARTVAAINRRFVELDSSDNPAADVDFGDLLGAGPDLSALRDLCDAGDPTCIDHWRTQRTAIDELARRYDVYLRRLARLHELPGYAMTMTPDSRAPLRPAAGFLAIYKLQLAVLGAECAGNRTSEALRAIAGEIALARRVMRVTAQLLSNMVATEQLRGALHVYAQCADLAARGGVTAAPVDTLAAAEISLREPYLTMFRETHRLLLNVLLTDSSTQVAGELPDWVMRPFIKHNRSSNLAFAMFTTLAELSELPPGRLAAATPQRLAELKPPWHEYVINPVGAILHEVAIPSGSAFTLRIHDVDGLISLVNARLELRSGQIDADRTDEALATSRWRNPYDGSALSWDAATRTLWFTSPNAGSRANRLSHAP